MKKMKNLKKNSFFKFKDFPKTEKTLEQKMAVITPFLPGDISQYVPL
jgi:hypothetical protein